LLSDRAKELETSQTMIIFSGVKKLKSEGVNVIDLGVGEPDFNTPENIKIAGKKAIDENKTKYTLNQGTVELRKAIIEKLKRDNNIEYNLNEIVVSNGAKQSIYNSILTLVNPGDEVILPSPYWISYPSMVKLAGGKIVTLETDESNGFKLTAEQLSNAISSKTKLLILCNPSNPTGSVYNSNELESLAEIVQKNNIFVISDEIYEKLVYDDFRYTSFASLGEQIKKRTILINGISKSYAMTGWRIGYSASSPEISKSIDKIQGHTTSGASSISQSAAVEALQTPQYILDEMRNEYKRRRDFLFGELVSIDGISCHKSEGTFYLFPNVSKYFNNKSKKLKINNSVDLAMHLLHEAHVAVVPGSGFGKEGYLRLSYSTSMDNIQEAVKRLQAAFAKI
jgi:aspartate/methionine/tyrosine aminotransferase